MKRANKYFFLLKVATKDRLHSPGRLLAHVVVTGTRVGILIALYAFAFDKIGGSVKGVNLQVAAWSMAAYFIILSLNVRRVFQAINQDVISGNIEVLLNKPFQYVLYRNFLQVGYGMLDAITTFAVAVLLLPWVVGAPQIGELFVWGLQVFALVAGGMVLAASIYTIIALSAFWIDDASPLYWIFDKAIMILGGSYIPVALFPHTVYSLALFSPFGATMFATHAFYGSFGQDFWKLLSVQLAWVCVGLTAAAWCAVLVRRHVSVHGG